MVAGEVSSEQQQKLFESARRIGGRMIASVENPSVINRVMTIAKKFQSGKPLVTRFTKQLDAEAMLMVDQLTLQEMELFSTVRNEADLKVLSKHGGALAHLAHYLTTSLLPTVSLRLSQLLLLVKLHAQIAARKATESALSPSFTEPPGHVVSTSPIQATAPPCIRVSKHRMISPLMRVAA